MRVRQKFAPFRLGQKRRVGAISVNVGLVMRIDLLDVRPSISANVDIYLFPELISG